MSIPARTPDKGRRTPFTDFGVSHERCFFVIFGKYLQSPPPRGQIKESAEKVLSLLLFGSSFTLVSIEVLLGSCWISLDGVEFGRIFYTQHPRTAELFKGACYKEKT
jgi:hypothetical protein